MRAVRSTIAQALVWLVSNSLAGAMIGLTVGFFNTGVIEGPTIVISVLFGNVVGFTAFFSASILFPRLRLLARPLRLLLLGITLLTGAVSGSVAVLYAYPLFVARDLSQAASIVAINGVLSVVVGGIVFVYENMRFRLEASLRETDRPNLAGPAARLVDAVRALFLLGSPPPWLPFDTAIEAESGCSVVPASMPRSWLA